MKLAGIIFVLGVLHSVYSQRTPTISYISQEQIKVIGDTAELVCSVQNSEDYPVLWMKVNKNREDLLPISTNTALIIRDSRFALRSDPSSSTYTLQIKDVQEADAGFYICQILISTSSKISAEVELQTRSGPPVINAARSSKSQLSVNEGRSVELECYAEGYPTPTISWRRESNATLPTGGSIHLGNTLSIKAVSKNDRGMYYCSAENGIGEGARHAINLIVHFSRVVAPRPRVGQALKFDANLECRVEAYPPAVIVWIKDGVRLSNDEHHSIANFTIDDLNTKSELRVKRIGNEHYGEYVCTAVNYYEHWTKLNSATVELFETSQPVCPPACNIQEIQTNVNAQDNSQSANASSSSKEAEAVR